MKSIEQIEAYLSTAKEDEPYDPAIVAALEDMNAILGYKYSEEVKSVHTARLILEDYKRVIE